MAVRISDRARRQAFRVAAGAMRCGAGGGADALGRPYPPVGTIGVVYTASRVARPICWWTRSAYDHAVTYVGDGYVVEAEGRGAVRSAVSRYYDGADAGRMRFAWILEDANSVEYSSDAVRWAMGECALATIGTPYAWWGIVVIGLLRAGIALPALTRYAARQDRAFCSQLVDDQAYCAGVHLFRDERANGAVAPGDLVDRPGLTLVDQRGRVISNPH